MIARSPWQVTASTVGISLSVTVSVMFIADTYILTVMLFQTMWAVLYG